MASEWQLKTIAECASNEPYSTQIGPFGKALMADEYTDTGIPVLRGVNVNFGRFHDDDFVFISEETAHKLSKFEAFPGDVLLVHKGTLGKIGLMPKRRKYNRYIMGNSMMRVMCDPTKLLPEFLYYWLSSADGQQYLLSRVSQVGVPQLQTPLTTLRQATLPVPSLDEQRAIIDILGTLDDAFESKQKISETLEAIARAIFRSWFVDFDPVRTKTENREPDSVDAETAALFPCEFEASELGEIPIGWKVSKLGQVADVNWGDTTITKSKYTSEGYPAYSASGQDGLMSDYMFDRVGVVVSAIGANCGATWLALGRWSCIKNTLRFWATDPALSTEFLFHSTNHKSTWPKRGSAQPFISQGDARTVRVLVPSNGLATRFGDLVRPLHERIDVSRKQMRILADLRDNLLPRLVSGKLRIPAAEELVEAVL